MTETVGVVVPVVHEVRPAKGALRWRMLASRAGLSAIDAGADVGNVVISEATTLHEARNKGGEHFRTDWLIFLDADDELGPDYIQKMLAGTGDVRQPYTIGVYPDGYTDDFPVRIPPQRSMLIGNHLIIGSMVRRELFLRVGGFRDLPILEDWDFWIRCWLEGAKLGESEAVYRVHVNENSRNSDHGLHGQVYSQIQNEYWPTAQARGLV